MMPQLKALMDPEVDWLANSANIIAALKSTFGWLWVGIYRVVDDRLILGPFQGPLACTIIAHGKGVCGRSWAESRTIVVPDVDEFPGHIACSTLSRSEIVVPIVKEGKVLAVIDVDSDIVGGFDEVDKIQLEEVAKLISENWVL